MLPLVITVQSGDGHVRRYAFAESPVTVGRSPLADLQLSEPFISRWEGTLRFDERSITYFSLGSTNPPHVDGVPAQEREDIQIGPTTVLSLGELRLRFFREPLPDADVRRKGKPRPVQDGRAVETKTVYLDVAQTAAALARARLSSARAKEEVVVPPDPSPARAKEEEVRTVREVRIAGDASGEPSAASTRPISPPPPPPQALVSSPRLGPITQELSLAELFGSLEEDLAGPMHTVVDMRTVVQSGADLERDEEALSEYARYRAASERLVEHLDERLARASEAGRAEVRAQIERECPEVVQLPAFRALLERYGLAPSKPQIEEVRSWLQNLSRDVLPANMDLDTGITLERILTLVETLTQSLAEVNEAQDSIRRHWLGRAPRHSVLRSENGRAILAYLLNPQADWGTRLRSLEQTVREVVTHEIALFKATFEGARFLVEAFSPDAIAEAEGVDLASLAGHTSRGFWDRWRGKEALEARLWRRVVSTHEALMDGERYQRVFLGRVFAKTYLAAMGQSTGAPEP